MLMTEQRRALNLAPGTLGARRDVPGRRPSAPGARRGAPAANSSTPSGASARTRQADTDTDTDDDNVGQFGIDTSGDLTVGTGGGRGVDLANGDLTVEVAPHFSVDTGVQASDTDGW
jgi:hypothetical protein